MKGDIAQIVHGTFWKHNKDVKSQASPKLVNTERYLRAAKEGSQSKRWRPRE